MKFAWKVFLSTIIMIAAAFAVGGYILITSSFETSLERETDRALEENLLMNLAYESASTSYVSGGSRLTDEVVTNIAAQLGDGDRRGLALVSEEGNIIFSNAGRKPDQELITDTDVERAYSISE